jgi:hypothetical protein
MSWSFKRLDHRGPPGQHVPLRHAPSAQGQEHGDHDRELLRQHRHGRGDARQQSLQPIAACQAIDDHDHRGGAQAEHGDQSHQPVDLPLQSGALGLDRPQRRPDPAELGAAPVCFTSASP